MNEVIGQLTQPRQPTSHLVSKPYISQGGAI